MRNDKPGLNPHHETQCCKLKSKSSKLQSLFLTDVTNVLSSHGGILRLSQNTHVTNLHPASHRHIIGFKCASSFNVESLLSLQLHWYGRIQSYDAHTFTLFVRNNECYYLWRWKVFTNNTVFSSFKNRGEWNDSVSIANKRSKLAMAANFVKTRL